MKEGEKEGFVYLFIYITVQEQEQVAESRPSKRVCYEVS